MNSGPSPASEIEIAVLENIYRGKQNIRQRDLARITGVSLGMTNSIVRRLAQKGLLTIRKLNSRNIRYAVSPAGMEAISRRTVGYVKRTIRNVVLYRDAIRSMIRSVHERGYRVVRLVGESDLGFIVEHACGEAGLHFSSRGRPKWGNGCFNVFSESQDILPNADPNACASLHTLLVEAVGQNVFPGSIADSAAPGAP